jgi:protein TonB
MKSVVALIALLPLLVFGQSNLTPASDSNKIYLIAQQMPKFNGSLVDYLTEHLSYPKATADKGTQGTVIVSFVVEKDGAISNVKASNKVEHSLDSAAMACVSTMPKWSPGMQNGRAVRVQYELPIRFEKPVIGGTSVNPDTPPRVK